MQEHRGRSASRFYVFYVIFQDSEIVLLKRQSSQLVSCVLDFSSNPEQNFADY